ncbi:MAG: hypothetical protein KatS3mg019_0309 [Fimbriimonadales bacterium]|nr:MAG: hypothetical protein KatS3mg019_0309 [Fimbriimonadales bacterium]
MQKRKVAIVTRDPLLKAFLEQRLNSCEEIELVESTVLPEATIMEHRLLTRTEQEVLQRVADCGSVQEAARSIPRSEATLKRELEVIREKLGVRTTLQAVVWALRHQVIR